MIHHQGIARFLFPIQRSALRSNYDTEADTDSSNTELNLGARVDGEVEKKSFLVLPGKWDHSGLMPSKLCVPIGGGVADKDQGAMQGPYSFNSVIIWHRVMMGEL